MCMFPYPALSLWRWELCPLENHDHPTCGSRQWGASPHTALWQQTWARGSLLSSHSSSPWLQGQCLQYTKCSHHGKRGELALAPLGTGNYSCQFSLKGSIASCPFQQGKLAMPAEASKESSQERWVQIRWHYQDPCVQFQPVQAEKCRFLGL